MQIIDKQNINVGRVHLVIGHRSLRLRWWLRVWMWIKRVMTMRVF